jgi:hypothetical protein
VIDVSPVEAFGARLTSNEGLKDAQSVGKEKKSASLPGGHFSS